MEEELNNNELLISEPQVTTTESNSTPKQEDTQSQKTEEKMNTIDISKLSLNELKDLIERKKEEIKNTKAESLDWKKMSLDEVRAFVVNQALAAGKENPEFSDEFVKDYKKIQIEKQLEREKQQEEKDALIEDASMEEVYNWILEKNDNRTSCDSVGLEAMLFLDKCPYKLTKFCDIKIDPDTGLVTHFSFAVASNGHAFTNLDGEHWTNYMSLIEKYVI